MKILFFGFSVTEAYGSFARLAKAELEQQGHEVQLAALGGIHPDVAAFLFPLIIAGKTFDHIVLDIFTSTYRSKARTTSDLAWPCLFMAEQCLRAGAYPTLLPLYRADVDPDADAFAEAGRRVAQALDVGFIDGARLSYTADERKPMLKDVVHPTEEGSKLCLQRLWPHLQRTLALPRPAARDRYFTRPNSIYTTSIAQARASQPAEADTGRFERAGIRFDYVRCTVDQPVSLEFDEPCIVNGLGYLMGPRSGRIHVAFDRPDDGGEGGFTSAIDAFDEYCYYERYHARPIEPRLARRLDLSIDPTPLAIALKKGEPDPGPREARLCHLYCSTKPLEELIAEAALCWTDPGPSTAPSPHSPPTPPSS